MMITEQRINTPLSSTWYETFFTELPNEFWRRAATPELTAVEVDFIERSLELKPGSRIVDVPCGSGRHALALAERGHSVHGIDISAEAIGYARRAAAEAGISVELTVAEMRQLPRDATFDAAICMGNSFGYLEIDGLRDFVEGLAAAVRPGGGVAIDCSTAAELMLPGFVDGATWSMQTGDIHAASVNRYDAANSREITAYTFTRGAETVEVTALHHVYTSAQIGQLLTDAGFTDVTCSGGPDGAPFTWGSSRLLVTARR